MELTLEQIGEYYQRDDHPMNAVVCAICDAYLETQPSPVEIQAPPRGYVVANDNSSENFVVIGWYPRFSNPRGAVFIHEVLYESDSYEDAMVASWNIYENVAAVGLSSIKEAIRWE